MATVFPTALLALTPLFDVVRLITRNPSWARAGFWSALVGAVAVVVALVPQTIDWLASDRHLRARGAAALTLHLAALCPLALGVFERLHPTTVAAWPFALAIAGMLAWLGGEWMTEARVDRVRYQPTGLPASW